MYFEVRIIHDSNKGPGFWVSHPLTCGMKLFELWFNNFELVKSISKFCECLKMFKCGYFLFFQVIKGIKNAYFLKVTSTRKLFLT